MNYLKSRSNYNVAIAGATGAVGNTFLNILEERKFPIKELKLLASERSKGKIIRFKNKDYKVEKLKQNSFKDIDIAFFSAGASRSLEFVKYAVDANAVVIDNSSAFRMNDDVPLVVPEVNPNDAFKHKGIIANPNCTTIVMIVPLKPLYDYSKVKRVVVSSYQASSGAGAKAMQELLDQARAWTNNDLIKVKHLPYQLLFNVIPHVDKFMENGYTKEEIKMFNETRKILHDNDIKISATCVRVPVISAHSEAIYIETEKKITASKAKEILSNAKGVRLLDDPLHAEYPMPLFVAGKDDCYIGRIREDISLDNGLVFWSVGDQLRKGAALNAVQIAELLI